MSRGSLINSINFTLDELVQRIEGAVLTNQYVRKQLTVTKDKPLFAYRPGGKETKIHNGIWEIIDHLPYEPSALVWSECYLICPIDYLVDKESTAWEAATYSVDAMNLIEAIDPDEYARILSREKEWPDGSPE